MQIESALPPIIICLNHKLRCYTLRALKLSQNHPIKIEIDCAIKLVSEKRASPSPNSKTTQKRTKIQFERLVESIFDLTNLKNLEYINHFYFAPWDKKIDFNIRISDQPKEKEAICHLKYLESICNTNTVSIYTDGSQMTTIKGLETGFSFAVYKHNIPYIPVEPSYIEYWNTGDNSIVYNSELEAVTKALEYASDIAKEGVHFNIFTDNQASILRLNKALDKAGQNCQIRSIIASKNIKLKKATIDLMSTAPESPTRSRTPGAILAKLATNSTNCLLSDKTSFAFLGIKINELKKQEFQALLDLAKKSKSRSKSQESYSNIYPWTISNKINLSKGTIRVLASSFFQLKIGHGYLKSYLYRLNLVSNNKYKCGLKETILYLLLYCKNYTLEHKALFIRIREKIELRNITLPILFYTKIGISKILVFLKEISICTRNWHLEKEVVEEEDIFGD